MMRKLLMTGSALMLLGGVALAQTPAGGQASTAGPNNTTVTGQEPGSTSGNVSTGSTSAMQPAMPSKDHTTPTQRRSTMSKTMKSGTMGANESGSGTHSMSHGSMNKSAYISHSMGKGMPTGQSAGAYLHMAQHAVMKHDKMMARDALGRAETDLLTNSYVQGSVSGPISTPAISDIRGARQAVTGGDYHSASMMIHKAMMDMHGGGMMNKSGMNSSGSMGSSGMNSSGTMGNTGMMNNGTTGNNGGMSNSTMSSGGMSNGAGGTGAVQGKQNSSMHKQMTNSTSSQ